MFRSLLAALFVLASLAPLAASAQEPGGDVPVPVDLMAVLKLRGKPCQSIESWERQGESDYLVRCSDGPRYRIHVDAEGRVSVEEQ